MLIVTISQFELAPLLSDCAILVGLYGLIFSIPFHIVAHILLFVGTMRTEHIEDNRFHRTFEFCEKRKLGRILLLLALFSPTLTILAIGFVLCQESLVDVTIVALFPWILSSLAGLLDLKYRRKLSSEYL